MATCTYFSKFPGLLNTDAMIRVRTRSHRHVRVTESLLHDGMQSFSQGMWMQRTDQSTVMGCSHGSLDLTQYYHCTTFEGHGKRGCCHTQSPVSFTSSRFRHTRERARAGAFPVAIHPVWYGAVTAGGCGATSTLATIRSVRLSREVKSRATRRTFLACATAIAGSPACIVVIMQMQADRETAAFGSYGCVCFCLLVSDRPQMRMVASIGMSS